MLIDLRVDGRNILVIGGGVVGERKARRFIANSANVTVASKTYTAGLKKLSGQGRVRLVSFDAKTDEDISRLLHGTDIVIAATDDQTLNERIASQARKAGVWVGTVDNPLRSDLRFPAIADKGGIQIAVYTGGKSPAMAKILRQRIERIIKKEDILQVRLLSYARSLAKSRIKDRYRRRRVMYRIIRNKKIASLLRKGSFEKAKILARETVERE
jgi:precorrin-2 dehydrogenase/sirohydrochlorin ferrochelatase